MAVRRATERDAEWVQGLMEEADQALNAQDNGDRRTRKIRNIERIFLLDYAESWVDTTKQLFVHLEYLPESPQGDAVQIAYALPVRRSAYPTAARQQAMGDLLMRACRTIAGKIPHDNDIVLYGYLDDAQTRTLWAGAFGMTKDDVTGLVKTTRRKSTLGKVGPYSRTNR